MKLDGNCREGYWGSKVFKDTNRTYYAWKGEKLRAARVVKQYLTKDDYNYYHVRLVIEYAGLGQFEYDNLAVSYTDNKFFLSVEDFKNNKPVDVTELTEYVEWDTFFKAFPSELGSAKVRQVCNYTTRNTIGVFSRFKVNKKTGNVVEVPMEVPCGSILVEYTPEGAKPIFTREFVDHIQENYGDMYVTKELCERSKMDDIDVVDFEDEGEEDKPRYKVVTLEIKICI